MTRGPRTVGELVAALQQYNADTPIEFTSTDGYEYGWLDIGTAGERLSNFEGFEGDDAHDDPKGE